MSVTFYSPILNLKFLVEAERHYISHDGKKIVEPARFVEFVNGFFTTNNEKIIETIRNSPTYKEGKITEITEEDILLIKTPHKTHRGTLTTGHFEKEMGKEEEEIKIEKSSSFVCETCEREFTSKNALRFHQFKHRREGG